MWEIAAGVIIGGAVLGTIWTGLSMEAASMSQHNKSIGYGYLMALVAGVVAVWIVFFKVHF